MGERGTLTGGPHTSADRMGYFKNLWAAALGRPAPQQTPQPALTKAYGADHQRRLWANEQKGGVRVPWVPVSLRWLPEDVEACWSAAEQGDMYLLGQMIEGMRLNGTIFGLMEKRASITRLPIVFSGDPFLCEQLRGVPAKYTPDGVMLDPGVRGDFEIMCPPEALGELIYSGVMGGFVAYELVDDPATGLPVVSPRNVQNTRWDWSTHGWVFQGSEDVYRIEFDKGRWGMYSPGGKSRPWKGGAWLPCALAFVSALAGTYDRMRWQALLADPLKWIAQGEHGNEAYLAEMDAFIQYQWARAPGIALPKGYTAGYAESRGEGYKVYAEGEDRSDRLIQMALAGNTVSAGGGSGFVNASIWDAIDESLIQKTASGLARSLSDHLLPIWAHRRWSMRHRAPRAAWDVRSPARRRQDAEVLTAIGNAIIVQDKMLEKRGEMVDYRRYYADNAIVLPTIPLPGGAVMLDRGVAEQTMLLPASPPAALLPPADEGELASGDEPPTDEAACDLAMKMTAHGVDRCEHQRINRCWLCGIERVRDFEVAEDGTTQWRVGWRPIANATAAAAIDVEFGVPRDFAGLSVVIDRPIGFVQQGPGWERTYTCDYGYIPNTTGGDGEDLDVFVSTNVEQPIAWWIRQVTEAGEFDEYKLVLGAESESDALAIYFRHVPERYFGGITQSTVDQIGALVGREPAGALAMRMH